MLFVVFANLCSAQVVPVSFYRSVDTVMTNKSTTDGFKGKFFKFSDGSLLTHNGTNFISDVITGQHRFQLGGSLKATLAAGGLSLENSLTVSGGDVTIGDYMLRQGFSTANALYRPISGANTGVFGFSPNTNLGTELHLYTHDRIQNSSDYGYYKIETDSTKMKFSQVSAGNVTVDSSFEFAGHVGIGSAPHSHIHLNIDPTVNVDADDIEWFGAAVSPHAEATTSTYDAPYPVIIGRFFLAPGNTQDWTYSPWGPIGVEGAFRTETGSSGTITGATALLARMEFNSPDAIVTSAYGLFVQEITNMVGTPVRNNYGIYVRDHAGQGTISNYNIYSAGSGLNHFNGNTTVGGTLGVTGVSTLTGNTGIGITPTAKLDVLGEQFLLGGNNGTWTGRTNATTKTGYFTFPHYTTSEENVAALNMANGVTDNTLNIGGGTSTFNSATIVRVFTAANNTTMTGTERMRIDGTGNLGVGLTPGTSGRVQIKALSSNANIAEFIPASSSTARVTIDTTGKFGTIASLPTEGLGGVPIVVDTVQRTGQTASITSTNFSNSGTVGDYEVSYYIYTTTAGAAGTVTFNIIANDGTSSATWTSQTVDLTSTTITGKQQGTVRVRLGSGNIQWSTTVSGASGSPQYAFYATAKRID